MSKFELSIHILIVYTFIILLLLLIHRGRKQARSLFLALYSITQIITNATYCVLALFGGKILGSFPQFPVLYSFSSLWVPLFYLFVLTYFDSAHVFRKKQFIHFIPFIILLVVYSISYLFPNSSEIREITSSGSHQIVAFDRLLNLIIKAQMVIYIYLMLNLLLKQGKQIEKIICNKEPNLKWVRLVIYGYAFGCMLDFICFVFNYYDFKAGSVVGIVTACYFYLFFFVIFYKTISQQNSFFVHQAKLLPAMSQDEMQSLMQKIETIVVKRKMFLNAELSLHNLSTELNEKERNISMVINVVKGRNLRDYISFYRIEYAKKLLISSPNRPVFEIMYECGFNTKGAFNLTFKKMTGQTPSEYRQRG